MFVCYPPYSIYTIAAAGKADRYNIYPGTRSARFVPTPAPPDPGRGGSGKHYSGIMRCSTRTVKSSQVK